MRSALCILSDDVVCPTLQLVIYYILPISQSFRWHLQSVRLLAVKNPENDPFGVDLESTLASHQSLVFSFPLLENFSLELVGLANLSCGLVVRAMLFGVELLQLAVYKDLSTRNHRFPPHVLPSTLLTHLLLRSDPMPASSSSASSISVYVPSVCAPDGASASLMCSSCLAFEYPKKVLTLATVTTICSC
jgi:hypothetical protein